MTELLSRVEQASDSDLLARVRGGEVAAYGELYSRHVEAARRLGRQLVRGPDADDLVSEAFARTLDLLHRGGGPDVAFRAYLLTSVRRLHVDRIRAARRLQASEDMTVHDGGVPFQDKPVADFESGAAARAFRSLPERWQLVLWHLEVEGQKPADIAPLLGMSSNSVSALAYRAREGLRQAFLTMHVADAASDECRWVNRHLGGYVRKALARRDVAKVEAHLEGCRRCAGICVELDDLNSDMAAVIAPVLLGTAAAGYVGSSGGLVLSGLPWLVARVREALGLNGSAASGAGATAGAGGAGGVATAGGVAAATAAAVAAAALTFGGPVPAPTPAAEGPGNVTGARPGIRLPDPHRAALRDRAAEPRPAAPDGTEPRRTSTGATAPRDAVVLPHHGTSRSAAVPADTGPGEAEPTEGGPGQIDDDTTGPDITTAPEPDPDGSAATGPRADGGPVRFAGPVTAVEVDQTRAGGNPRLYTLSGTVAGVTGGGEIVLEFRDRRDRFCTGTCEVAARDAVASLTVSVPPDAVEYSFTLSAWLPAGPRHTVLLASYEGGQAVSRGLGR